MFLEHKCQHEVKYATNLQDLNKLLVIFQPYSTITKILLQLKKGNSIRKHVFFWYYLDNQDYINPNGS